MKRLKFAMLIAISMMTACAASDAPSRGASESAATETELVASDQLTLSADIAPRASCNGAFQACATGPVCHHQEGRNIGVLGCPAGTICCQF